MLNSSSECRGKLNNTLFSCCCLLHAERCQLWCCLTLGKQYMSDTVLFDFSEPCISAVQTARAHFHSCLTDLFSLAKTKRFPLQVCLNVTKGLFICKGHLTFKEYLCLDHKRIGRIFHLHVWRNNTLSCSSMQLFTRTLCRLASQLRLTGVIATWSVYLLLKVYFFWQYRRKHKVDAQ